MSSFPPVYYTRGVFQQLIQTRLTATLVTDSMYDQRMISLVAFHMDFILPECLLRLLEHLKTLGPIINKITQSKIAITIDTGHL